MIQEYKQEQQTKRETDEVAAPQADAEGRERRDKMSDDIDALLDEIDGVLEVNAAEFVQGYIQAGGE